MQTAHLFVSKLMASFSIMKVLTSVFLVCLYCADQYLSKSLVREYETAAIKGSEKMLVCYYKCFSYFQSGITPEDLDSFVCSHIIYDFGHLNETTYQLDCGNRFLDIEQRFYQRTTSLKKSNPNLKVILCMGGWSDSTEKYSILVGNKAKRDNFISTSISFLKQYDFDGLDVNWEYPNCWQGKCGCKPSDKENFVIFLQELHNAYGPLGLCISVSVSGVKWEIDQAYDVPGISAAVDFINVMCYDFHGPWEPFTGHHAQFRYQENDKYPKLNMFSAVNYYVELGADMKKLNPGVPTYGTTFTLKNPVYNGLGSPASGMGKRGNTTEEGGMLAYYEICGNVNSKGWTQVEVRDVGTYAYKDDQWVGYDSPLAASRKARFIKDNGFGGIVIKSIDTDDFDGSCSSVSYPTARAINYGYTHQLDENCQDTKSLLESIKKERDRELNKYYNDRTAEYEKAKEGENNGRPKENMEQNQNAQKGGIRERDHESKTALPEEMENEHDKQKHTQDVDETNSGNAETKQTEIPENHRPEKNNGTDSSDKRNDSNQEQLPKKYPQDTTGKHPPNEEINQCYPQVTPTPCAQTPKSMTTESYRPQEGDSKSLDDNNCITEQEEPSEHDAPTDENHPLVTPLPYEENPDTAVTDTYRPQEGVTQSQNDKKGIAEQEKPSKHNIPNNNHPHRHQGTSGKHKPNFRQHHPQVTATPNVQTPESNRPEEQEIAKSSDDPSTTEYSPQKQPFHYHPREKNAPNKQYSKKSPRHNPFNRSGHKA